MSNMRANRISAAAGMPRTFARAKNQSADIRVQIAGRLVDITPMWDEADRAKSVMATRDPRVGPLA
jgi:hypothetical protein